MLKGGFIVADSLGFQEQSADFGRTAFDRASVDNDLGNVIGWRRLVLAERLMPCQADCKRFLTRLPAIRKLWPFRLCKPEGKAMAFQKSLEEMERERIVTAFRTVGECFGKLIASALSPKTAPAAPVLPPELNPYLLNCKASATFLGISVATLRRLTKSGRIKSVMIGGRARRYPREELEKFANRREFERGQRN